MVVVCIVNIPQVLGLPIYKFKHGWLDAGGRSSAEWVGSTAVEGDRPVVEGDRKAAEEDKKAAEVGM